MKKQLTIAYLAALALPLLILFAPKPSKADSGYEAATRVERGAYIDIAKVTGSSVAGTAFIAANTKRPDGLYFNNTASTVWIGTTSATMLAVEHSNITNGMPWLSSSTFKLDGQMVGALYFTCNIAVSACEVRKLEGLVP